MPARTLRMYLRREASSVFSEYKLDVSSVSSRGRGRTGSPASDATGRGDNGGGGGGTVATFDFSRELRRVGTKRWCRGRLLFSMFEHYSSIRVVVLLVIFLAGGGRGASRWKNSNYGFESSPPTTFYFCRVVVFYVGSFVSHSKHVV